jgi:phosphopantothenoylcysteine decarboxylase / phosphopantothenate---cysteine ligase
MSGLAKSKILLAISGGIAACKSYDLIRQFTALGCEVRTVVTQGALQFVTALTLQALTGHAPRESLWDSAAEAAMSHIELARWPDTILLAPASANMLAKLAHGIADDLFSTLYLATDKPLYVAPAMNRLMWQHPATQHNIELLKQRGVCVLGPGFGKQACGEIGLGRMLEPADIIAQLQLSSQRDLQGQHVVITAGPTREAIDPVRYLTNHSSGKMGYALATAAVQRGAKVTLISGPTQLTPPAVEFVAVQSAQQMYHAVMQVVEHVTVFIGVAAVADYTPVAVSTQKIKKCDSELTLKLKKTIDIVAEVARLENGPFTVAFAAETEHLLEHAKQKFFRKQCDMLVANDVSRDAVFGKDHNRAIVITKDNVQHLEVQPKLQLAARILDQVRAGISASADLLHEV